MRYPFASTFTLAPPAAPPERWVPYSFGRSLPIPAEFRAAEGIMRVRRLRCESAFRGVRLASIAPIYGIGSTFAVRMGL
jgi:hypothetical protein